MVEDWNRFLTKIEELKLYMVKFNEDSAMKTKNYLVNYAVEEKKHCSIIIITYDKYIFFANNRIWKA